jgi:hypothetical protein
MGTNALVNLTTGTANTAAGSHALGSTTEGSNNSAFGLNALLFNTTGEFNTANGYVALQFNSTGSFNTATGAVGLGSNSTGSYNTAIGSVALVFNTTGNYNSANGFQALYSNSTGNANTAQGANALFGNTTGIRNVAVGYAALRDNSTGKSNTAIGWYAGRRTTGNDNILIAHRGITGESQTMRLGTPGTPGVVSSGITRAFIAGVRGVATGLAGTTVLVDSKGQLGTISSSRRFKNDIQPMADASERLQKLRPVTFRYNEPNAAGEHPIQYGLIAEEVAEVFPELVVRNEDGQPESVAYHVLPTLLLNELQKVNQLNQQNAERLALLQSRLTMQESQQAELSALKQELAEVKQLLAAIQPEMQKAQLAMRQQD